MVDLYQYFFDNGLAGIEVHTQEMYAVGDMICELGTSEGLTSSGHVLSASRYMTLWKTEEGKWRAHRDYLRRPAESARGAAVPTSWA
jgi:hypothetical protein